MPKNTTNIIIYDPLPDRDNGTLPRQRPYSTHPHLRPTIKRMLFENSDLEHDDLLELYGYDEERGCSRIELEQCTEIEIPIEDEQGVTTWIAGEVSIYHEGSLDFRVVFPGSSLDTGVWSLTEMTWMSPGVLPLHCGKDTRQHT